MADNTTNAAKPAVETAPPTVEAEVIDLESAKPQVKPEKTEAKPAEKPINKTKAFSDRLNEETRKLNEEAKKAREEAETAKKEADRIKRLYEASKKAGYIGEAEEKDLNSAISDEDKAYEERKKKDPDFAKIQQLEKERNAERFERQKAEHYEAIKEEYPDLKAKNMDELVKELGKEFAEKLDKGYDPVDAYDSIIKKQKPKEEGKPPTAGSTKSSGNVVGGEFYTIDEINGMTFEQRETNREKVQKSLAFWRKQK